MVESVQFQIETPLTIVIRTTKEYWEKIVTIKQSSIKRFEKEVKQALEKPDQIRRSKQDG